MSRIAYICAGIISYILLILLPLRSQVGVSPEAAELDYELSQSAHSPYDIQRFVDTHTAFRWEPLWKALNIPAKGFGLPQMECEARPDASRECSSELITVLNPPQIIVLLRGQFNLEVYLRFRADAPIDQSPRWHFGGYYHPEDRWAPGLHRIVLLGKKPFLAFMTEGAHGTGLSTKWESWIDLSRSEFEPVFGYVTEGHLEALPIGGLSREVRGFVVSLEDDPVESITVNYHIDFQIEQKDGAMIGVGDKEDDAVYSREQGGDFRFDERRSTASADQIYQVYQNLDSDISNEDYLRYTFKSLKSVAIGQYGEASRIWLTNLVANSKDTPEKIELNALLKNGH